ncbi:MAG: nuclear transport factor 2 family protein [Leptolyngbya sp. SIO1D8]|nr:nuclear transport factor 2 family protein [Leptolyngbya sp. SIO1D8]
MTPTLEQTSLLSQMQTVECYFQTFNQGDFLATAQLFAESGQLLPPFETPILGQDAIHDYLEQEAAGMQATPKEVCTELLEAGYQRITVRGNVKALVFSVNAAWIFELDPQEKILQVEVRLLASLQDLLAIRPA